jgi:uncharacterized protein (DUF1778 family)
MAKTARLELRITPELKAQIEATAAAEGSNASDFVRSVVEERMAELLERSERYTVVSPEYFDWMLRWLEEPVELPTPAMREAMDRWRRNNPAI